MAAAHGKLVAMFELLLVAVIGAVASVVVGRTQSVNVKVKRSTKERMEKLWDIAQKAMRERKYVPAERALLMILKFDHKNAAAYNRLGILYAQQSNFVDAVECFEVASSLDGKASSLHNLGLIYYEIDKYDKAGNSFQRALEIEPTAARHIAYAKTQQKLGKSKNVVAALEEAAELEPSPQTYKLLIESYQSTDNQQKLEQMYVKLREMQKDKQANKRVTQENRAR